MSKTLLLADDSVVIQKLVGLSFANEDVEIIATDNGDDAVTRAGEVNPDVVLADVVMPGKNGYEVCEAIKQNPDLAHVPVLLLTGTFEAFDENRASEVGANGQITKPFEAQSLVERVNAVMREASAAPAMPATPITETISSTPSSSTSFSPSSTPSSTASTTDSEAHGDAATAVRYGSFSSGGSAQDSSAPTDADAASADASGFARRITDDNESPAGLDASESDFFSAPHAPQFSADTGNNADTDEILSSPGLELSQDLEADFSDSPLAAYAGPAASTRRLADDAFDHRPDDSSSVTEASLPPAAPARGYGAVADPSSTITGTNTAAGASTEEVIDDGLGLSDSLPLPDVLPDVLTTKAAADLAADPVDLSFSSSSADDANRTGDATILVGQDDVNAKTFPSYGSPLDSPSSASEEPKANPFSSDSYSVPAAEASSSDSNPLHVGPTSIAGEELDFAFDVSEQSEVTASDVLNEDATIPAQSVSASELIGRDTSEMIPPPSTIDSLPPSFTTPTNTPTTPTTPTSPEAPPENTFGADAGSGTSVRDPLVGDYDVSSSDLATASQSPYAVGLDSSSSPTSDPSTSDAGSSTPSDSSSAYSSAAAASFAAASTSTSTSTFASSFDREPVQGGKDSDSIGLASSGSQDGRISDLSPMMEQRIQETLEKVAWEAFSDLSETIVKQVIARVEQVAWDVIPEMAETLVREEIRLMKGEED